MFSIEKGTSIIEASAGTGKTYTLCRIVLKLIVEKGIPIDRILAITFTQAATEELISRIRELLHDCLSQIGAVSHADFKAIKEDALRELLVQKKVDVDVARNRLRHSLEIFDDASISTIHGFCKRSLDYVSLESDVAFEANLEPIDDELVASLQDEYARIHILEKSALLSAFYATTSDYEKRLKAIAKECASHPYAILEPPPTEAPIESIENAFETLLKTIEPFLSTVDSLIPHLKKNTKVYKRLAEQANLAKLQELARRRFALLSDLDLLKVLTASSWKSALKKSGEGLEVPSITTAVDTLLSEKDRIFTLLISNYREWLFENLRAEKERRNVVSFNDLLHILNRALNDEGGDAVARAISEQFDAALVDEFQDTDPTQYKIIQRLFGDDSKYLFFIGDPKQAIYRFRGADIFSYFNATESSSKNHIRLSNNYRSSRKLVHAVNTLFHQSPDGFAFDKIRFEPVNPAAPVESDIRLQLNAIGLHAPNPLSNSVAINLLASAAAEDFARRAIEDPNLDLGDVAFLVGTNREADVLMQRLALRGIDCVLRADRSVFQSEELEIALQLLDTLSNPSRASAVRALLLTPIGGYTWRDLLEPDFEEKSQKVVSYLHDWSRNWRSSNFDAAFRDFLRLTGAARRLLGQLGGERRYANLCQLSELLQSEALTRLTTPKRLFAWLHGKRDENVSNQEDWQTRLISDEGKPQIVTIHKSKGLEFPVVICPFLSLLRPKAKRDYALYHTSGESQRMVIDLSPEASPSALDRAEREEYAEQLRLIYVALTRAVDECVVYLAPEEHAPGGNPRPSSFCQLVLGSERALGLHAQKSVSPILLERIQEFDSACIAVSARPIPESTRFPQSNVVPDKQEAVSVRARPIVHGSIPTSERILSFSTITRITESSEHALEEIDNDEVELKENPDLLSEIDEVDRESNGPSIFDLPKGAHTGNLVHSILEELDFQKPDSIDDCVNEAFIRLRYGHPDYRRVVAESIRILISKPLANRLSLDQIGSDNRVPELEFAYPTSKDALRKIQAAFEANPTDGIPRSWVDDLAFDKTTVRASLLRGFIDLVFEHEGKLYIIDWKSNHLGNRIEAYQSDSLETAMSRHDYFLQYCLYSVALKRYLEIRMPDIDYYDAFGGVFYLFLRGISKQADSGVFFDRPSRALLDALDEAIGQ